MNKPTLQIQSVVYGNEKNNLIKAIQYVANAVRVEKKDAGYLGRVKMIYGDGSPTPVFTESEIHELQKTYRDYIDLEYRVFGYNTGSAKGHNLLGETCTSDYMLIMNPDVIMSPRTLIELMVPFDDERVGMVEARQSPIEHPKEYNKETMETDWATTACAVFPTKLFNQLNGFDYETFFLYCDDLDFSWRLRLEGYKIIYQPLAPVFHAKRLNSHGGWMPTKAEVYYSSEAALMMAHKWSNPKLVKQLLRQYQNASLPEREAASYFIKRRNECSLPTPIDPNHEVAVFINGCYTVHRFAL